MELTILDIINLTSSLASLLLSIIAIWLSLYFFIQSKNTEKNVNEALTEIKTHTGTLERLTGKWMERLTRFVTSPQPMDAAAEKLLDTLGTVFRQGNKQIGTVEVTDEQPLLYKEEEAPQFVKPNVVSVQKKKGKR
jgi:hypothetical protein